MTPTIPRPPKLRTVWCALVMTSLLGCRLPTEPDAGCIRYEGGVTFSGRRLDAWQCWGGADYRDYQ